MGNKKSKPNQTKPSVTHTEWPGAPSKSPQLKEVDYQFLVQQTGMPKADLKIIFDKFMANNPDGKLDRKEFVAFYSKLRPESPEDLNEISEFIFRAFDNDKNGFVSFNEFMVSFLSN
jgi:Ca2+-binding EF-hand superfamily protein